MALMNQYIDRMEDHLKVHPQLNRYDDVYYEGNKEAQEKYFMATVFNNLSPSDFTNPCAYLTKRIHFLEEGRAFEGKEEQDASSIFGLPDVKLVYGVEVQHPNLETPFVFTSRLENSEKETYELPRISFGTSDGVCSIYAIQDKEKHDRKDAFYKRVKRTLYKVGKGVDDPYFDEKITDVSPSSICALSLFLGFMAKKEIENYEAIPYLPIRYQGKRIVLKEKTKALSAVVARLEDSPTKEAMQKEIDTFFDWQDHLQENITNKFVRSFMRMAYHLDNLEVTSFPNDVDSTLHFKNHKERVPSQDHLVGTLYHTTLANHQEKGTTK